MNFNLAFVQKILTLLLKSKSLLGLVVCSALTTILLASESTSYAANTVLNQSYYIAQSKQPNLTLYTVQPGDFLSSIAEKFYADGSYASWRKIYEANRAIIGPDPTQLQPGMVLVIPEGNLIESTPSYSKGRFKDMLEALGRRETGKQNPPYNIENWLGAIGKYQFIEALLIDLKYYRAKVYYPQPGVKRNNWKGKWTGKNGINSKKDFLNNKNNVQEKAIREAFALNLARIKAQLKQNGRSLEEFIGDKRGGVVITTSGILGAAHLRGETGVVNLLLYNQVSVDENGTSILAYLQEFGGYQTPFD